MKPRYRYNWNAENWTRVGTKKNQMIPANEINLDIALTTIGSVKRAEDGGGVVIYSSQIGGGGQGFVGCGGVKYVANFFGEGVGCDGFTISGDSGGSGDC